LGSALRFLTDQICQAPQSSATTSKNRNPMKNGVFGLMPGETSAAARRLRGPTKRTAPP